MKDPTKPGANRKFTPYNTQQVKSEQVARAKSVRYLDNDLKNENDTAKLVCNAAHGRCSTVTAFFQSYLIYIYIRPPGNDIIQG